MEDLREILENVVHRLERVEEATVPKANSASRPDRLVLPTPSNPRSAHNDHRTAPDNLIPLWPSVSALLEEAGIGGLDDYVSKAEHRPVLDVFANDGPTIRGIHTTPLSTLSFSSASSGKAPGQTEPGLVALPDLSMQTVNELHQGYLDIVHPMHPFLDTFKLQRAVESFIAQYSCNFGSSFTSSSDDSSWSQSIKRKRSDSSLPADSHMEVPTNSNATIRSLDNTLVWLVLALGKICLHRTPLLWMNPAGTKHALRNIDVIPGLDYYSRATDGIGDQAAGSELIHAHIFLLAGLYKGQLARVKESMNYIAMAGRVCLMLVHQYRLCSYDYSTASSDIETIHQRGQARIKDWRDNLIVLTSWTCIQLESDMVAEIRLPSSGITEVEDSLPLPYDTNPARGACDSNVLLYYTAQIGLRKRLNRVHREIYGDQCLSQSTFQVQQMLLSHMEYFARWRECLPSALAWDETDALPDTILAARLQAKYWGGCNIVHRVFLDYALHILPHVSQGKDIEAGAVDVNGNLRNQSETLIFGAIRLMGGSTMWNAVEQCIHALMKSTEAFDGTFSPQERLIVTNIHGTAHA